MGRESVFCIMMKADTRERAREARDISLQFARKILLPMMGQGATLKGAEGQRTVCCDGKILRTLYMPPTSPPMYLVIGHGGAQGRR